MSPRKKAPARAPYPQAAGPAAAGCKAQRAQETCLGVLPSLVGSQLRLAQRAIFADCADAGAGLVLAPEPVGILVIVEANPGLKQSPAFSIALPEAVVPGHP